MFFFSEVVMFSKRKVMNPQLRSRNFTSLVLLLAASLFPVSAIPTFAQGQSPAPPTSQPQDNNGKPKQDAPSEAGGPTGDIGPYSIPKKNPEATPPPQPPPASVPKVEGLPDYSIKVNVPLVNVDVLVTTRSGQFVPGLKRDNFRLFEDGSQQQITNFNVTQAPVTAVLLVEFASTNYFLLRDTLVASYSFANTMKKEDWVAVTYYDMQPHILVDFTQDKRAAFGALNQLRIPGFAETNEFDSLYDTLDRLERIEGKKYVILISTGVDTFSKLTLDKITRKIKDTKDVTIFAVSIGWALREYCETHGCTGVSHGIASPHIASIDYLQADNQMRTFASMTGGRAFFPRFEAEFGEIFQQIGEDIRKQYSLSYHPTNSKMDGTYRKLKVQVVAADGGPLKVKDQKGKDQKIEVVARDGYTAKHTVD
jgi:VWFA-related protein